MNGEIRGNGKWGWESGVGIIPSDYQNLMGFA